MRTGLTNNRNVLTATTHRSTATPVYLQYPKYVAGVEHALHMAYKHLICKCKNSFAFTDFQFANLVAIFTNVYKYKDTFYNRPFILKRAKKELTDKEVARFKREFDVMNGLSSPYILEVYCYNPDKNEYIMEYMDYTLDGYIAAHNSTLTIIQRKGIAQQILRAFDYLHSKGHLHRDISPKNILIKEYDDTLVVKRSDFGLVKIPDSTLTTVNTEFKGYFNDPALVVEGFNTYGIVHETYALTRVIYFVMTGKTNTEKIANQNLRAFVERGLNPDKTKRFQNIRDMISAFKTI